MLFGNDWKIINHTIHLITKAVFPLYKKVTSYYVQNAVLTLL